MENDLPMAAASHSTVAIRLSRTCKLGLATAVALLAIAAPANASVGVGSSAGTVTLKVDAKGNAEIGSGGKTVLVPVKGNVLPGGTLDGPDVSKPAKNSALPYVKVLRSGPNGWFYAVQIWPVRNGPTELRFSRWKGQPTKLTFTATKEHLGIALEGKVTYGGKPIPMKSPTPGGILLREYVYLDQQLGGQWKLLGGVAIKSNGSFRRVLFSGAGPTGTLFRASVAGPNIGQVYAPDMIAQIPPP
jgi:hypothetical protein